MNVKYQLPLSQTAACDSQVYTVNFDNPHPGTQTNIFPLFKDQKQHKIQINVSVKQICPNFGVYTIPTYENIRMSFYLETFLFFTACKCIILAKALASIHEAVSTNVYST